MNPSQSGTDREAKARALLADAANTARRTGFYFTLFAAEKDGWTIPRDAPLSAQERLDLAGLAERARDAVEAWLGAARVRRMRLCILIFPNNDLVKISAWNDVVGHRLADAFLRLSALAELPEGVFPDEDGGAGEWAGQASLATDSNAYALRLRARDKAEALDRAFCQTLVLHALRHATLPLGGVAYISIRFLAPIFPDEIVEDARRRVAERLAAS